MLAFALCETAFAASGTIVRVSRPVEGEYIVIFDEAATPDAAAAARELVHRHGLQEKWIYDAVFHGFSFSGTEAAAIAISNDPRVRSVQESSIVEPGASVYQSPAPSWGLDRINQQFSLTVGDNLYSAGYTGAGTVIYLLDSGITPSASEFGARIRYAHNWAPDANGVVDPDNTADCHNHGTMVASLAAGATYGVAKEAELVNLRVLDCDNRYPNSGATVIAAINWMIADHMNEHPVERAVANMSLFSDGIDAALDEAALRAVQAGINVVACAGNNSHGDACGHSPARAGDPSQYPQYHGLSIVTVGAIDEDESFSAYSNSGNCVDILGPGSHVTAIQNTGTPTTSYIGTSFATPFVAGVIALHMERYGIANNPRLYESLIKDNANRDQVSNVPPDTPNLLIYSGIRNHGRICCN
jgi:subtilisin family serine protease